MANLILSSNSETNIFSDSFNIITDQNEVIFTSEEEIVALSGYSYYFEFTTASKKLITVKNYKIINSQLLPREIVRFNTKFLCPFITRDCSIMTHNMEQLFSREVLLTCIHKLRVGDRDGSVFTFADDKYNKIVNIQTFEGCILKIEHDYIFTTRCVYEEGTIIYGPAERLDGGVAYEDQIYVIVGDKIVEVTSGEQYHFECEKRLSESVPQLQIGILDGGVLVFCNTGFIYYLDGSLFRTYQGKELSEQEIKQAWFVSEEYANGE